MRARPIGVEGGAGGRCHEGGAGSCSLRREGWPPALRGGCLRPRGWSLRARSHPSVPPAVLRPPPPLTKPGGCLKPALAGPGAPQLAGRSGAWAPAASHAHPRGCPACASTTASMGGLGLRGRLSITLRSSPGCWGREPSCRDHPATGEAARPVSRRELSTGSAL